MLKSRRNSCFLSLRQLFFFLSLFLKWHHDASHLILSSSSSRPLVFLCLSSSHSPPASTVSPSSCISSLALFTKTRVIAPPVCFVVQLPGFPSQSHYWLLLNTRKQPRGTTSGFSATLLLYPLNFALWFPASCKIWSLWGENASKCWSLSLLLVYLQPISNADFIVPVEIDGTIHQVLLIRYGAPLQCCAWIKKKKKIPLKVPVWFSFLCYLLFSMISRLDLSKRGHALPSLNSQPCILTFMFLVFFIKENVIWLSHGVKKHPEPF